jgi:hypothetical protein
MKQTLMLREPSQIAQIRVDEFMIALFNYQDFSQ